MSEDAPPKLFEHCSVVYEAMKKVAKGTTIEGTYALVYEGYLTRLFADLQMAMPYYTTVMRRLKAMDCVQQLARGGGSSPSRWQLLTEPSWDSFAEMEAARYKNNTQMGQAQDAIRVLTKRMTELEERFNMHEGHLVEKAS
jgi:hypothetical protein